MADEPDLPKLHRNDALEAVLVACCGESVTAVCTPQKQGHA
jgi:hypothetical protein